MMRSRFSRLAEFSGVMAFVWRFNATTWPRLRGRVLVGMEPDMRTFTITMPSVAVFIFGSALCCFRCFKYGLQRWYERTLVETRTKTRSGITYATLAWEPQASLEYRKEQLEHALREVRKLRRIEPTRSDLKYEAVASKKESGCSMSICGAASYCEGMKRPSLDTLANKRITMVAEGNSFVNRIFNPQQPAAGDQQWVYLHPAAGE